MRILRAAHLGMCFGVRDAITLASQQAQHEPATVLGQLVHNESVLNSLRYRGLRFADDLDEIETGTVIITAHGSSERNIARVRERGFNVIEATCPLVHHAHSTLQSLVREGSHPIIIGKRDHVEVRGLTGDLDDFDVVLTKEEVEALRERPRFGVVSQTTQPIDRVQALVVHLRAKFPNSEIVFRDTVCQPTKQRQRAAVELAQQCDVVVVIGGAHSNNTRELVETCRQFCQRVHHVQHARDLCAQWFEAASSVGITAGTSTPDNVIDAVESAIAELAAHKEAA